MGQTRLTQDGSPLTMNFLRRAAAVVLSFVAVQPVRAQQQTEDAPTEPTELKTVLSSHGTDRLWLSGQMNLIFQLHPDFPAAYSGDHSLRATSERELSHVLTLFTGVKVTDRTDVLLDIESAGGRGISDALGLAGFTDLDVVRNPELGGAPYLARLMIHQTLALGEERTRAEPNPLALARTVPVRRIELRAGKFGTADFFDLNSVGGDSHLQFMNWTVDNNGAYDYAADTRGYTWGAIVEYDDRMWAVRFGEMLMPKVANGIELDWNLARARADNLELEWHSTIWQRATTVRVLSYINHANMGDYREAVQRFVNGVDPSPVIENTRQQGRTKYGFGFNAEQQLTARLGAFVRSGWNEPHHESFAYTEVHNTVALGADYKGQRWHRPEDKIGAALVSNGLSEDHARYLQMGGKGFLLGDGALNYGREDIGEFYYTARLWRGIFASADLQRIANPGYNRDRGPVDVFGLRMHADF